MEATSEVDYFTDHSVLLDPYDYFDEVRGKGPVHQLENRDIVMVTGYAEALEVLNNPADFSSVIAPGGPVVPLPFEPEGADITDQIEAHRSEIPTAELLVALDDRPHSFSRAILNRLFVPSRLKANEQFIWKLADEMVRDVVAKGRCELITEVATPFVTLVIADLLGVPAADRDAFTKVISEGPPPGSMDAEGVTTDVSPLEYMAGFFIGYILDRRANPRQDVLTELASAQYPDGSIPDVGELVRLATFLFGAGQDTSAKLLANSLRYIIEVPGLQQLLREDRSRIAPFIEEVLRLEGSSKVTFRLARKDTRIGDVAIPAGKKIMIALAAANRDPRRWEDPQAFRFDRLRIKEHLAFGRGPHVCSGAPLARVEIRIILDRFLEHASHIDFAGDKHGGPDERRLSYEPSFIVRGLSEMFLTFTPSATL